MGNRRHHTRHCTGGLRLLPLIVGGLLAGLTACSSIDCPVQNLVYTQYALMKADGTTDTLAVDTLSIWTRRADGSDSLLLNRLCGATATGFDLPISYTHPEDVLVTLLADTLGHHYLDTIRIKKDDQPHFESVDCQAAFFHTLTAVSATHNAIDSIRINHASVTYDTQNTHIYLYLAPRY